MPLLVQSWYVADGATIFDFTLISALGRPLVEEALFGFKIDLLVTTPLAIFEAVCSLLDIGLRAV